MSLADIWGMPMVLDFEGTSNERGSHMTFQDSHEESVHLPILPPIHPRHHRTVAPTHRPAVICGINMESSKLKGVLRPLHKSWQPSAAFCVPVRISSNWLPVDVLEALFEAVWGGNGGTRWAGVPTPIGFGKVTCDSF